RKEPLALDRILLLSPKERGSSAESLASASISVSDCDAYVGCTCLSMALVEAAVSCCALKGSAWLPTFFPRRLSLRGEGCGSGGSNSSEEFSETTGEGGADPPRRTGTVTPAF